MKLVTEHRKPDGKVSYTGPGVTCGCLVVLATICIVMAAVGLGLIAILGLIF